MCENTKTNKTFYRFWKKYELIWTFIPIVALTLLANLTTQVQAIVASTGTAYWNLDETSGPSYTDSIGAHDGVCAGSCPTADSAGLVNGGQIFDGATTGITVTANTAFDWGVNDSFSVEFWVKATPGQTCASADQIMVGRADSGAGAGFWSLGCTGSSGTASFRLGDSNGVSVTLESTKTITNGVWHHIAGIRDGVNGVNYLYVDGIEVISATQAYTGSFAPASADISLGYLETGSYFKGTLDEVAIYDGVLSATDIQTHYYLSRGYADACATPVSIMPLGDSITKGSGTIPRTGYRKPLYLSLTDAFYSVDFVGSANEGGTTFDDDHEGHSGWYADAVVNSVADKVYNWLVTNPAEVVLLHIGTNDIDGDGQDPASLVTEVEQILDEIDRYNENITVILAQIVNMNPFTTTVTSYNSQLAVMAETRVANGDKVIVVDQENALIYPDDLFDTVHPNSGGYQKMADVWLPALTEFMPVCAAPPQINSSPVLTATVGQAYAYDVNAAGTPVPTYTLTVNPAGMTIDEATGLISWTPATTGTVNVTVEARNSAGIDPQSFVITITENTNVAPAIISNEKTQATVGQPYSYNVDATGTPAPTYTLSVSPTGMTINEATGLISWTPTMTGNYSVTVEAHNLAGMDWQSYSIAVGETAMCLLDMTAYWALEETSGAVYYDSSGNYDGACVGTCPTPVAGLIDGGQQFTSSGDGTGVNVPVDAAFDWGQSDSFSIEYWMKGIAGQTCTATSVVIGREDPNPSGTHWWIGCSLPNGVAKFELNDSNDNGISLVGPSVSDGNWHHVVGVRDGANNVNYLYVDGTTVISATHVYTAGFESATAPLNIGWFDNRNLSKTFNFDGTLDEMAIYGRALTPAEILNHYNDGLGGVGYCDALPTITSTPVTEVSVGQPYTYTVQTSGLPVPTYTLTTAPSGMTVMTNSGVISWTPGGTGIFSVTVEANNRAGMDTQSFAVTVTEAPAISSTPLTEVEISQPYTYAVQATGYPTLTYALTTAPGGMIIDSASGIISWTPGITGTFNVTVEVSNTVGLDSQSFAVVVTEMPAITSSPVTETSAGQPYSYDVTGSGYPTPTFALTTAPAGMTIGADTGLITWTPSAGGVFAVTVEMSNMAGTDTQSFTITVTEAATITSSPVAEVKVGQPYSYTVGATGYPTPTFALATAPAGMTIDPNTGIISWTPSQDGAFSVTVTASNSAGTDSQSFDITVSKYYVYLPIVVNP